jgi:hypothetical protein
MIRTQSRSIRRSPVELALRSGFIGISLLALICAQKYILETLPTMAK